jgi:hypothetical protein
LSTDKLVLALILVAATSSGASGPELDVMITETELQVGDRLVIRVVARGGDGLLWGEPRITADRGAWAVVDGPRALAGSQPPAWQLTIAPLLVGEQALPEVRATVRSADGTTREAAVSGAPLVRIASVLPAGDQEIEPAPLRDPIGAVGTHWEWLMPVLAGIFVLLVMLLWWRHRRSGSAVTEPAVAPLIELKTLIEALRKRIGREPAAGICDRLAGGLRCFLERRTGEPAQEMTSHELHQAARRLSWPAVVQRSLQQVLATADGVRFARRDSTDAELGAAVEAALVVGHEIEAHLAPAETEMEACS